MLETLSFLLLFFPQTSFAVGVLTWLLFVLRKSLSLQKLLRPRGPGCGPVALAVVKSLSLQKLLWPRGPSCGPVAPTVVKSLSLQKLLWPRGTGCGPVAPAVVKSLSLQKLLWPCLLYTSDAADE